MKLAPKLVESFLAKPDAQARACLLYGPDTGLSRERMGRIKACILAGNDDPFAYVELEESKLVADPAALADELNAISLMGGKRCIVIRAATDKLTKTIEAAADYFHAGAFVMVVADELSTKSSLRAWFEKSAIAVAAASYKDEMRDVQGVIRTSLSEAGITPDRDVMDYLAGQLGNDRFVTRQELEKIITYAGAEKVLSLEDVRALVEYNRDTNLDELVNAVGDKNLQALEKNLTLLAREAASPVMYLRALQRYFNRLYALRTQMQNGNSAEEVVESARPPVFFRQKPVMIRHLHSWDLPKIAKALALFIEAEMGCKTSDLPPLATSGRKLMQATQVK